MLVSTKLNRNNKKGWKLNLIFEKHIHHLTKDPESQCAQYFLEKVLASKIKGSNENYSNEKSKVMFNRAEAVKK